MKTKTKIAIVLFILQIIAIAGLLLGNSSGNYLAALGEAIGICAFTIAGIILVCLDSKQPQTKNEEHKIGFAEESTEEPIDEKNAEDENDNRKTSIKNFMKENMVGIITGAIVVIGVFAVIILAVNGL